ncbi:hypothetical protein EV401DRAFT_2002375, partial [Pisolithus croceorrhizus]
VSLHAAPTPNSSYVLGSYPSSMLSLFRLGSQPSEWGATNSPTLSDVEPQVVEVFKSKDRYIFKHGEQTECLPTRLGLTPATFYQRLLLCSCSAEADPVNSMISITLTMESRILIPVCSISYGASPNFSMPHLMPNLPLQNHQTKNCLRLAASVNEAMPVIAKDKVKEQDFSARSSNAGLTSGAVILHLTC